MRLKISYFAKLKDEANKNSETVTLECQTPKDVFLHLQEQYNFSMELEHLNVAINEKYECMNTQLNEGDHVVFIPPVAGG